jgi:hypothetical protein
MDFVELPAEIDSARMPLGASHQGNAGREAHPR